MSKSSMLVHLYGSEGSKLLENTHKFRQQGWSTGGGEGCLGIARYTSSHTIVTIVTIISSSFHIQHTS